MKESRFEPPLNMRVQPKYHFFNEEWNEYPKLTRQDEDHEDFVDTYIEPNEDTTYYDDYEDYGN